jgi:hypothetical protein
MVYIHSGSAKKLRSFPKDHLRITDAVVKLNHRVFVPRESWHGLRQHDWRSCRHFPPKAMEIPS